MPVLFLAASKFFAPAIDTPNTTDILMHLPSLFASPSAAFEMITWLSLSISRRHCASLLATVLANSSHFDADPAVSRSRRRRRTVVTATLTLLSQWLIDDNVVATSLRWSR